jgi:hypothetical protein
MYPIDRKDEVVPRAGIPPSSMGAPYPIVVADEFSVTVAYFIENVPSDWDGTSIRVIGPSIRWVMTCARCPPASCAGV